MKAGNGCTRWRGVVGVLAVGLTAFGFALHAAPNENGGALNSSSSVIRVGSQFSSGISLPIAPPIHAYRVSTVLATEGGGELPLSIGRDMVKQAGNVAGAVCQFDIDCNDCNGCTTDTCIVPAGQQFGTCDFAAVVNCSSCEDNTFCNGREFCNTHGICLAEGVDICANAAGTLCNETGGPAGNGECSTTCTADSQCPANNDALFCNGNQTCAPLECVGGSNPGDACTDLAGTTECLGGGVCTGVCRDSGNPCGEGAVCDETAGAGMQCGNGRCCRPDPMNANESLCSREPKASCEADGGAWLGQSDRAGTPGDDGECGVELTPAEPDVGFDGSCPKYAAGVVPAGPFIVTAGPIGPAACQPIQEIGDDYSLPNSVQNGGTTEFFTLRTVNLVWGWNVTGIPRNPSRIRLSFYDAAGNLVEDTITGPVGGNGEVMLRSIIFSEEPVIPASGFMTLQVARRFSPFGEHFWNTTDVTDVGTNDPNLIWLGSGPTSDLTILGGAAGVFAFELVGSKSSSPDGACCSTAAGTCGLALPWICEAAGDFFQGVGTSCKACSNDLFRNCLTDPDCPACVGGTNDGDTCDVDGDCTGGGTCTANAICETTPPACTVSACCDAAVGTCSEVSGGLCDDLSTTCNGAVDCAGIGTGACTAQCPAGTTSQGFGTSCGPNLCIQPAGVNVAGDTCSTADIIMIDVPLPGELPLTVTISGDNSNSTFGDFTDGTCPSVIHDATGATQDRGWWQAFSINACANVRLDMCGTNEIAGEIKQPQWSFLRTSCNSCLDSPLLNTVVVEAPIGNEVSANDRGAPFCNSDDLWQTYGPIPAGTYWHNIYSAPGGTFGQYQMHITVAACPEAACCLPSSICIDATTENIIFDGTGAPITCADPSGCPAGAACSACAISNQLDCATANGFFNGFGSLPAGQDSIVSCAVGACEIGTCCEGAGSCRDQATVGGALCDPSIPGTCMTRAICDGLGGAFQGGQRCDFPLPPCPSCAVQGVNNCQFPPNGTADTSDLRLGGNGVVVADDFVPAGNTLETVCVWGVYLDNTQPSPTGPVGSEQFDCIGAVPDNFRVRIYADNGGGLPGAMIEERMVSGAAVTRSEDPLQAFENIYGIRMQGYNLVLSPPITGMTPGTRHWLEVANGAVETPDNDTCFWNWGHFNEAGVDEHSVIGTNDIGMGGPGSGYINGSGRTTDKAFCLGITQSDPLDFDRAAEQLGACFICADGSCQSLTLANCQAQPGVWDQSDPTCQGTFSIQPGDNCSGGAGSAAGSLCSGGAPNGILDVGEQCDDGDDTDPTDTCNGCRLACTSGSGGGGGAVPVGNGLFAFDNSCATTDGPPNVNDAVLGTFGLGQDIWFEYTATCTGKLIANMCPTGNATGSFDSALAIYHNPADPTNCLCPGSGGAALQVDGSVADESCNGVSDGGPGISTTTVFPGECYLIRVGGFTAGIGIGLVDLACEAVACFPATPAVQEKIEVAGGAMVNLSKNRFISAKIGIGNNVGRMQAVRVTFVDLPAPYDAWNGTQMWAGAPTLTSESGGGPAPIAGVANFLRSQLSCSPVFRDWSADSLDTIHMYHEGVVPGGTYDVQVIDSDCNMSAEVSFSEALTVVNSGWGDSVGAFNGVLNAFGPPDSSVDITTDIVGILQRFSNLSTAPSKTQVDLEFPDLDFTTNIGDVVKGLDAFSGKAYPYSPSVPAGPCP